MTPEAQRIAIAEACGWKQKEDEWFPPKGSNEKLWKSFRDDNGCWHDNPPDYLNDLNAMHEAEKVLTAEQLYDFHCSLDNVMDKSPRRFVGISWDAHRETFTAAQRAEAFLRTLGLWTS